MPHFSRVVCARSGDFDLFIPSFRRFRHKEESTEAVGAVDPLCPSLLLVYEADLLHHDLVRRRIQRSLHPNTLAVELLHFILVIDVIRLARVILQHVLVALLRNGS